MKIFIGVHGANSEARDIHAFVEGLRDGTQDSDSDYIDYGEFPLTHVLNFYTRRLAGRLVLSQMMELFGKYTDDDLIIVGHSLGTKLVLDNLPKVPSVPCIEYIVTMGSVASAEYEWRRIGARYKSIKSVLNIVRPLDVVVVAGALFGSRLGSAGVRGFRDNVSRSGPRGVEKLVKNIWRNGGHAACWKMDGDLVLNEVNTNSVDVTKYGRDKLLNSYTRMRRIAAKACCMLARLGGEY